MAAAPFEYTRLLTYLKDTLNKYVFQFSKISSVLYALGGGTDPAGRGRWRGRPDARLYCRRPGEATSPSPGRVYPDP